jgi:hypothetical protein
MQKKVKKYTQTLIENYIFMLVLAIFELKALQRILNLDIFHN